MESNFATFGIERLNQFCYGYHLSTILQTIGIFIETIGIVLQPDVLWKKEECGRSSDRLFQISPQFEVIVRVGTRMNHTL